MLRDWSACIHQWLAVHILRLAGHFPSVGCFCSKTLLLSFPRVSPAVVSKECKFRFKYWSRLLCLHLLEAELRCSRQGNSSWTKPSLEWELTMLETPHVLSSHISLARDAGTPGTAGEDLLGQIPHFPYHFGSSYPMQWYPICVHHHMEKKEKAS